MACATYAGAVTVVGLAFALVAGLVVLVWGSTR